MNLPVQELPPDPGTRPEEEALSLALVPYASRNAALRLVLSPRKLQQAALQTKIRGADGVTLRLLDRGQAEFFIDEDPLVFHRHLTLKIAGSLAFAPGPEYKFPNLKEETA